MFTHLLRVALQTKMSMEQGTMTLSGANRNNGRKKKNAQHKKNLSFYLTENGARCWWRSWLRHCDTKQKVAGSIPDGVIGSFR
jgi:hypothetical protein